MITVVSDTHGRDGHRLEGRTLEAVREAELVVHAGDLTTPRVLAAFEAEAGSVVAVRGNNDDGIDGLDTEAVVDHQGMRIAVVHGHRHGEAARTMFARDVDADLLVIGHSHRPGFSSASAVPQLNPGSHAHPRWYRPAHAELTVEANRIEGRLREPDGTTFEHFTIGL